MFKNHKEQKEYIKENYPEITNAHIDDDHWDIYCSNCKVVRGFQVVRREYTTQDAKYTQYNIDLRSPQTIYFHCPVCNTYKFYITLTITEDEVGEDGETYGITRIYRITSIPGEGLEEIDELPAKPPSLRIAYRQAIKSMDANAHIAAAAMFRRALQVITRDILGAKPDTLANELKSLVGTKYKDITITTDFTDNGYIIKEAGNQSAHPDKDSDLLDFTQQDAEDLQKIFMEIVSDLFVIPAVKKKAKTEFLKRRKISI